MAKSKTTDSQTPQSNDTALVATDSRKDDALNVVNDHIVLSMVAGLAPWPGVDIVGITAAQVNMTRELCKLYGVEFRDEAVRGTIAGLIGSTSAVGIGRGLLGSLSKGIPGVGTVAGMLLVPAAAGATTYAVGQLFVQHFESGGTFLNFDPSKVKGHYKHLLDEGKKVSADLKSKI